MEPGFLARDFPHQSRIDAVLASDVVDHLAQFRLSHWIAGIGHRRRNSERGRHNEDRRHRRLDELELLLDRGALLFNRRGHRRANALGLLRVNVLHQENR